MPISDALMFAKSGEKVTKFEDAYIAAWFFARRNCHVTVVVRESVTPIDREPGKMLPDIYCPPVKLFEDIITLDEFHGLLCSELEHQPHGMPKMPPVTLKQLKEKRAEMERQARGEYHIIRHRPSRGIERELKELEEKRREEQRQKEPDDRPPPRPPTPPLPEGDAACNSPRGVLDAEVARAHLLKNGELYDASGNAVDYLEEAHVVCYFSDAHPDTCRYMIRNGEMKFSNADEVVVEDLKHLCEEADVDVTDVICHVGHETLRHRPWQSGVTRKTPSRIPAFGAVRTCSTLELLGILGLEGGGERALRVITRQGNERAKRVIARQGNALPL
jgi:hypothetical protein